MQKRILGGPKAHWDDFRLLLAMARAPKFTGAAKSLKVAETTVGRHIHALEARTGAKLLDRRLGGMSLTPTARYVLPHIELMAVAADEVERLLTGRDQALIGTVRVTSTDGLGSNWLTPKLSEFNERYPGMRVEIITCNELLDLGAREADIAIRYARPIDGKLIGLKMGDVRFDLVCAAAYAERCGVPDSLDLLQTDHRIVDHGSYDTLPAWRSFAAGHPRVVYRSNSSIAFLQALRSAAGIGLLPRFYRVLMPDMVVLNLELECELPVWLVCHSETKGNARIQAMWKFLKEQFTADRAQWFS